LYHDHQNQGVTNDGIGPGGNISAIVYKDYLGENGWPQTNGMNYDQYFSADYYNKNIPIWESIAPSIFSEPSKDNLLALRLILMAFFFGIFLFGLMRIVFWKQKS
jgi:hypothetical protein